MWGIKKSRLDPSLHGVFISICISKHFLTDADSVLFLPVSQQKKDEFCTDVVYLKFLD